MRPEPGVTVGQRDLSERWTQRKTVLWCFGWVAAHTILAVVLAVQFSVSTRPSSQLRSGLGFWATGAMAVQTPFLLAYAGSWRRWPWWAVAWVVVTLLSVMVVYPFALGFTFALCHGGSLDTAPCAVGFLLASQAPVGLLVGALQWTLLRRAVRRAGWLPLMHLVGGVSLTFTFAIARYDLRVLPPDIQLSAMPHVFAGSVYSLVMLLPLLFLRPRRGTVSSSIPLEHAPHDHHPTSGSS